MHGLKFSGHDTLELATKYGTPLYVMSEDIILERIRSLKNAFEKTGAKYEINFAGKAFTNKAMCKIIKEEKICLDAVSKGEIMTALAVGFPPENISFHGNNKKESELRYALENHIGHIMVDNIDELSLIDQLTKEMDVEVEISFRISPGISAHTHELIQTATEDSKFGLPYALAEDIVVKAGQCEKISVVGLHCHIGSQIVDDEPFVLAAKKMMSLYKKITDRGVGLRMLNLGGGFGIPYLTGDEYFDPVTYIPQMVKRIRELCASSDMDMPILIVEPGRYLTAEAGVTLYTIGAVKEIPGIKTYVTVDGGMNDNPRPALYGAEYEAYVCNPKDHDDYQTYAVSGRACETDGLIEKVRLNQPKVGDILMIPNTGAYNYTMASNYNRYPRPAVVLLSGERDGIIVRRETDEDVLRYDEIPDWL